MKRCLLLLFFVYSNAAMATIRYVSPNGAGFKNGDSWANALAGTSLQDAINASGFTDEVWVAAGTYFPTTGTDRSISFSMKNDVDVYGSFAGTETAVSQRVLSNGLSSILSGEIGVPGNADNSYHVISNINLDNSAVIDGFIISNANDDRPLVKLDGLGGGIYNAGAYGSGKCNPSIINCVIINNQAQFGAGIFNSGAYSGNASPKIINCVIANNNALQGGGGIDNFGLEGNASPTIINTVIYGNTTAGRAGAMYCWGGNNGNASPSLLNCTIVNNSALDGGGVVCDNLNSSGGTNSGSANPELKNCIVWNNTVSGTGPQFFILGTGTLIANYCDINLVNQTAPHVISGTQTANISTDPLFTNTTTAAGTDGKWLTADDGLQLQGSSPCVDTGNDSIVYGRDILNKYRIFGTTVDMGAYEYKSIATAIDNIHNSTEDLVYPNPAQTFIVLKGQQNIRSKVCLRNLLGIVVKETITANGYIDVADLPAGVYSLFVENSNIKFNKRIVIQQ